MIQKLLFSLFCLLAANSAYSDDIFNFLPNRQAIEAFSLYAGTPKGSFRGDTVITLTDGSTWKVDKKDSEKVARWAIDDLVHIGIRTSFYIVRNHKYFLHNHTLGEVARVMLIQYPEAALEVVEAQIYSSGKQYYGVGGLLGALVSEVKYFKRLLLSDGSRWTLAKKGDFKKFNIGTKVYLGVNHKKGNFHYYLISGIGSKGKWTPALKLN